MKRLLSLLVVIAMMISLIPNVFAAKEEIDMDELLGRLVVLEDIEGFSISLAEGSDGMIYQWTPAEDELAETLRLSWYNEEVVLNVTATTGETTVSATTVDCMGELELAIVAGQLVEIEISEAEGKAVEAYISGQLEYPLGIESNPIAVMGDGFESTIDKASWYTVRHNGTVVVTGEGDFNVIYEGVTYAAVDGKAEFEAVLAGFFAPAPKFMIDAAGTYTFSLVVPVGTMENPAELVIGSNTASLKAGAQGYFYTWIATEEGTLKITMPAGDWSYQVNNLTSYAYGDTQWSDSDPVVNPAEIAVAAGDEIQIVVNTYDPANMWETPAGEIVFTAELVLPEPPAPALSIVSQPESQVAETGATVTFSVVAEGEGLTYKWQYRNAGVEKWSDTKLTGYNTDTLTVANVSTGVHGRQYRVIITDANGNTVESEPATLQVPYLKKDSATAFGVPVNTDHVFSVEYSITEGVTYQWQYKGNTSNSTWQNTGMTGNKTPNLTVKALSTRNGYSYRCVIKYNGQEIITKAAILYVASEAAVVTKNPEPATAVCGDYATFTIEAQGEGALYHWQWYHEGTDTWVSTYIAGYHTPELKVKTNNYNGGRLYRCRIRTVNGSGWNEVYTEPAMLTVLPAAEVSQQPQNVTVKAGETAQFNIVAEGEGLTYQWQWAKFVGNWKNTSAEGATTEGIVLPNVSAEMNGRYYRVIITNAYGGTYTTEYAQLFVEE